MSEYQYYEFVAIDRTLNSAQMAELRKITSRATITSTRLQNTYSWGDFKGNPHKLVETPFDLHLYVANWGTRRLMIGLDAATLPPETLEPYLDEHIFTAKKKRSRLVLDLRVDEIGYDWYQPEGVIDALAPLRKEIMAHDLRPLYLAWLIGNQHAWEEDEEEEEERREPPPLPAGLATLSPAQQTLVEMFELDRDLLDVVATLSPRKQNTSLSRRQIRDWLGRQGDDTSPQELLLDLLSDEEPALAIGKLVSRMQRECAGTADAHLLAPTYAELAGAAQLRRKQREAEEQAARARAKEEREARRREELLARADERPKMWQRVESLVPQTKPKSYDEACELLVELRDLSRFLTEEGKEELALPLFEARLAVLKERHASKPSFQKRLKDKGL